MTPIHSSVPRFAVLTLLLAAPAAGLELAVSFGAEQRAEPVDGRVLLVIAAGGEREPRFQVTAQLASAQVFGVDVEGLAPGEEAVIGAGVFGYPVASLAELPAGEYSVQAVLHVYETLRPAHGHTVKLPWDRGEGQHWNLAPGNLLSTPATMRLDGAEDRRVAIRFDQVIPPIEPPADTEHVRHVRIESKLLTEFWGRPTYLGAHVLVPAGFDEHPEARYPLMIFHGHFPSDFGGFRTEPHKLIPFVEERFRALGEPWARFLYGGSTGGWEALAAQIFYPDEYNGCFAACPDPIDFRAYMSVDLYEDDNAYWAAGPFKRLLRPGHRDYLGEITATIADFNRMELALGTRGRSGDQFDVWQAVYSPVGEDGYPRPIWDKLNGDIDHEVAAYWRDNYDLRHILERDWATLGPKLEGKIRIYCGDMDNYYLNNAVYLMEAFLESTKDPYYGGEVDYGDRAEHCWNGDHENPNHVSRLRYNRMYLPKILERIEKTAPAGADLTSWRY